jgi:hypothetical protein
MFNTLTSVLLILTATALALTQIQDVNCGRYQNYDDYMRCVEEYTNRLVSGAVEEIPAGNPTVSDHCSRATTEAMCKSCAIDYLKKFKNETIAQTPAKARSEGFIFTGDSATNSQNEKQSVRLLERLPVAQLKKRFPRYKIVATAGEDCIICAIISRGEAFIQVNYEKNGIVVSAISSRDNQSADALGNAVGTSLRNATGATADCNPGESTTCASPILNGLHYFVEASENCPFVIKENQATDIPACAIIGGFRIEKRP